MARNYLYNPDLVFLEKVENSDLKPLFDYLKGPRSQELTLQKEFRLHGQNYQAYIREIIHEFQLFGGNTFANLLRGIAELPPERRRKNNELGKIMDDLEEFTGKTFMADLLRRVLPTKARPDLHQFKQGIPYEKILHLVCKRARVKTDRTAPVAKREHALLKNIAVEAIKRMSVDDIRVLRWGFPS